MFLLFQSSLNSAKLDHGELCNTYMRAIGALDILEKDAVAIVRKT